MTTPSSPSPRIVRFAGARSALQKIRQWWSVKAIDVAFYLYAFCTFVMLVVVCLQLIK